MRAQTASELRRIRLQASLVLRRHYARPLTVTVVARALACSPRQLLRAYERFGATTFHEELVGRRMHAAAQLLAQPAIPVTHVAKLVGYRQPSHFAKAFRRRYGVTPARYRMLLRARASAAGGDRRPARARVMLGGDVSSSLPARRAGRIEAERVLAR